MLLSHFAHHANNREKNTCDTEKHRLSAMEWVVAYELGKSGRNGKHVWKGQDMLRSIFSRVMVDSDMWLKTMRNPDVKFAK